jgi:SAM-dependent methyltransferase
MDSRSPGQSGFAKRFFAHSLASSDLYQDRIYGEVKAALFADLKGIVVEIGAGTGINLPYLPEGVAWIGIEPNPHMHQFIYRKADYLGRDVHVLAAFAEGLDFPDDSIDAVISTLVLCSVRNQQTVLQELKRILKPGGRLVFIEHVAAQPGTFLNRVQRLIRPFWRKLADGCYTDRETRQAIEQAGFSETKIDDFEPRLPVTIRVIRPHIVGEAIK